MQLDFGEWLPDMPDNQNPGAILAKNCIPEETSYRDFKVLAPFAAALSDTARGSFWLRSKAGQIYNFAGDMTKLYLFNGISAWADVSKPATVYSASIWDFTNFQERIIATDGGASNIQYFDAGVSATFLDLPGGPPRGKVVGVVRDFVLIGNYSIGAEVESGGLAWSGFNSSDLWTPALSTQSGRRRTRGTGGQVQRIVSGTQGLVFREHSILLVSYVGSPNVFQVDDITTLHGTPAPRSVAWSRDDAFYYSTEGFMKVNRRTLAITPIGQSRVDAWFRANAAANDIVNMQGTVDRTNKLVYWVFRSNISQPTFDRILVYNWGVNGGKGRFTYAELSTEFIGEFASIGYNLDTIGAILGGDVDSASIAMDDAAYAGGDLTIMAFNASHISGTFSGAPLTAEIDTKEGAVGESKRGYVNGIRPIVEAVTSPTIQVAPLTRERVQDNAILGSFVGVNAIGQVDLRVNARYHRYRVKIAGGFNHASRIEFAFKQRGRR